jgi:hypothetical protein
MLVGDINIKMDEHTFNINLQRAIDYFNTQFMWWTATPDGTIRK